MSTYLESNPLYIRDFFETEDIDEALLYLDEAWVWAEVEQALRENYGIISDKWNELHENKDAETLDSVKDFVAGLILANESFFSALSSAKTSLWKERRTKELQVQLWR